MKNHLVSIIIPTYNVYPYLSKCIESCINQTYSTIEIITVNDGSTDDSLNILKRYASIDNRIRIVDKPNGGLNSARKTGIKACTGIYATILDGDDYLEIDAIEKLVNILEKENADIVVGGANIVLAENNNCIDKIQHPNIKLKQKEYTRHIIRSGPNTVCMKLYKSKLIKQPTNYPNIKAGQDLPVTIQWSLNTNSVVFTSELIYNYVVARKGSTMSGDRKVYVEAAFDAFYYTFNILTKNKNTKEYVQELTIGTCAKLYKYLYHPKNKFKKKKALVKTMTNYVYKNRKYLTGKQHQIFIKILKISLIGAHLFVACMQYLKPTLHIHTK